MMCWIQVKLRAEREQRCGRFVCKPDCELRCVNVECMSAKESRNGMDECVCESKIGADKCKTEERDMEVLKKCRAADVLGRSSGDVEMCRGVEVENARWRDAERMSECVSDYAIERLLFD